MTRVVSVRVAPRLKRQVTQAFKTLSPNRFPEQNCKSKHLITVNYLYHMCQLYDKFAFFIFLTALIGVLVFPA